jgi:hypothetical protein
MFDCRLARATKFQALALPANAVMRPRTAISIIISRHTRGKISICFNNFLSSKLKPLSIGVLRSAHACVA